MNRSTPPKTLLQLSPTLFSQACIARQDNRIDKDVLHNGISYFLGPLLNWTLVGVVHAMLFEIQQRGCVALAHRTSVCSFIRNSFAAIPLEVLRSLLLAPTCPSIVLRLCSSNLLRVMASKRAQVMHQGVQSDIGAIRSVAFRSLGIKKDGN